MTETGENENFLRFFSMQRTEDTKKVMGKTETFTQW